MAVQNVSGRMLQRKDTAQNWQTANPILADGEIGYESDTRRMKFGDGTTSWASLPYYGCYNPGDTFTTRWDGTGHISGSSKTLFFTISLPMPIAATNVSVDKSTGKITLRQNGKNVEKALSFFDTVSLFVTETGIRIYIAHSVAIDSNFSTNNPIGIRFDGTFTFS